MADKLADPARPCPICGRPGVDAFRPFCSRRCADVDLHRWLSGVYAVPASEDEGEALAEEELGELPAGKKG